MQSVSRVEPASVSEVASCLAAASRGRQRVSIEKAGGDLVLSSRNLDRVIEHEEGDLTVTVEAGIRLSALNARLAESGQMLALDPPGDPTIGEILAGELFGPRSFRYGRPRDLVLGITLVLADGTIASAGGKVVKNVAGYDLARLVCGSAGRLGFIARASLRLHPLPASTQTVVIAAKTADQAREAIRALLSSELLPSAVDLLWPGRLAVLFEGSEVGVDPQVQLAERLFEAEHDDSVWALVRQREKEARSRRALPSAKITSMLDQLPESLIRLGPVSFLYGGEPHPRAWSALAERVRAEFDPERVLV